MWYSFLKLFFFSFLSLFIWSNETLNIWTHLLGFFYFFYLLIHDNFSFLLDNNGDFGDHISFTFMDITYMVSNPINDI